MTQAALCLSLTQFFMGMGFLLVFLATGVGLAWVLLYFRLRARGLDTHSWMLAYRFWVGVFALAQIGGASCREGVCQSVAISVCVVSIKSTYAHLVARGVSFILLVH